MSAEYINNQNKGAKRSLLARICGKKERGLSEEDQTVLQTLEELKRDLDLIHRTLDVVTDPILIDSFIYEMNAKNVRYKYYLNLCKEKGLVANF